jgi:hypothetical protein
MQGLDGLGQVGGRMNMRPRFAVVVVMLRDEYQDHFSSGLSFLED